jgi:hypothetical protein
VVADADGIGKGEGLGLGSGDGLGNGEGDGLGLGEGDGLGPGEGGGLADVVELAELHVALARVVPDGQGEHRHIRARPSVMLRANSAFKYAIIIFAFSGSM